jgi:large subunit ribosomal protein L10
VERAEKTELVSTLNAVFKNTSVIVVAHNKGLTVNQINDLRGKMSLAGATIKVAKNRLAKLALDGTDAHGIKGLFTGPTMIAYANDPVTAPKVAADFAKINDKFVVLGGALDQLRAKIIGTIQTPATRIAGILAAPGGQIARVINAYATKDKAA